MPFAQAVQLVQRLQELEAEHPHWHWNDCGCCVTVHGSDCAYVIGADGEATFYAERGCDC